MKENSLPLKVLNLNFAKYSVAEILNNTESFAFPDWARSVMEFIKDFKSGKGISCKTSGTTGTPKTIFFNENQLEESAKITLSYFNFNPGDKVLLPLSVEHIAGKMMVVRAIVGKLNLKVIKPVSKVHEEVNDYFDFTVMVPIQLSAFLKSKGKLAAQYFGKILLGGVEISTDLLCSVQQNKLNVWQSFGMTETISHFAIRQVSPEEQKHYTCLTGFKIDNEFNSQLRLSNQALGIKQLQTNDVVEIYQDGTFRWVGRADNVVNSGGYKLHPEMIESKIKSFLNKYPDFILVGIPDNNLGQKLVLFHENPIFTDKEGFETLKTHLINYEYPKEFIWIKSIQRTSSGKLIRKNYKEN